MAVDTEKPQSEVDDEFNRIVSSNYNPDKDPIQSGFDKKFDTTTAQKLREQELQALSVSGGVNQSENNTNDPNQTTKSIDSARDQEEKAGQPGGWQDKTTPNQASAQGSSRWRRKAPMAALTALLFGTGGLISVLLTPGLGIVHFKEVLFNDLNDQATALDVRATRIQASRLQVETTGGICTSKLTIGCRFKRFGEPFIQRIKDAGGQVTCSNGDCTNRFNNKIVSITFPDGTVMDDPSKFRALMIDNHGARSVMLRAYNPIFSSMWDKTAGRWLPKMGITRAPKKYGNDNEENKRQIREAGNIPSKDGQPLIPRYDKDDPSKLIGYADSDGKHYSIKQGQDINAGTSSLTDAAGGAARKIARGVIGSVGVIGAADTACSAINAVEMVSMGAKAIRTAQSILAVEPIVNEADATKATKGTPEGATANGEILTEVNTDENAIDDDGNTIPNPYLGLSAFDSLGYQTAAGFATEPRPNSSDSAYMVGTPTTGVLDSLSRMARSVVDPESCGVIQNPWVRAGSVIAGVAAAIFTGGVSTTQIVAQGAFSAIVSVGMAYAEALLQDLASGNMSENFRDVGVGNTSFVGVSEITQRIGGGRGMGYLTTENIDEFNAIRAQVQDQYVAVEKFEAKKDPFNPMLQYSFAGILARQLLPIQYSSSLSRQLTTIATLPLQSIRSIASPAASALDSKPYHPARYNCQDETYKKLGIKADVFCNLRRAMTKKELNSDPVAVSNWMVENNYVDGEADTSSADIKSLAKGDYKKFLDYCVDKSDKSPGTSEEGGEPNWSDQRNCIDPVDISKETLSNFRVLTVDYSAIEGLDNEAESISGSGDTSTAPASGGLVTGDARDLARQVVANGNIIFVKPNSESSLTNFANTGQATNSCGQPFTIDPMLLGVMLTLSSKYRILVGNIGFSNDRNKCNTGEHPKGKAIDINGIEVIGGGKTSWGSIRFTSSEMPILTSYANDWLAALPPNRGGVGQQGCRGFTITPPPNSVNTGNLFFPDDCTHLHIDVRER